MKYDVLLDNLTSWSLQVQSIEKTKHLQKGNIFINSWKEKKMLLNKELPNS